MYMLDAASGGTFMSKHDAGPRGEVSSSLTPLRED